MTNAHATMSRCRSYVKTNSCVKLNQLIRDKEANELHVESLSDEVSLQ